MLFSFDDVSCLHGEGLVELSSVILLFSNAILLLMWQFPSAEEELSKLLELEPKYLKNNFKVLLLTCHVYFDYQYAASLFLYS